MLISALIAVVLLSGCATALSEGGLTVIEYSEETQSKAADEIEANTCPVIGGVFMPDYSVLRDQARIK